jgi:hypothetical protein
LPIQVKIQTYNHFELSFFSFLHRHDEAFSTEPMKGMAKDGSRKLEYNYVQASILQVS